MSATLRLCPKVDFLSPLLCAVRKRFDAGMYEPLYLSFNAYPAVIPRVRVRGVMALFLALSILWALVW